MPASGLPAAVERMGSALWRRRRLCALISSGALREHYKDPPTRRIGLRNVSAMSGRLNGRVSTFEHSADRIPTPGIGQSAEWPGDRQAPCSCNWQQPSSDPWRRAPSRCSALDTGKEAPGDPDRSPRGSPGLLSLRQSAQQRFEITARIWAESHPAGCCTSDIRASGI